MNSEDIKKWIIKADHDLKIARDEIKTDEPATDAVCFHVQQCVEKYLKAYLVLNNKDFRKTHNIAEILKSCIEIDPDFINLENLNLQELTIYATELRYPEYFYIPEFEETERAIEIAEKVKVFVVKKIEGKGFKL